jgi:hypothetical protein
MLVLKNEKDGFCVAWGFNKKKAHKGLKNFIGHQQNQDETRANLTRHRVNSNTKKLMLEIFHKRAILC